MPLFRGLNEQEAEILLHKLQNETESEADQVRSDILTESVLQEIEKKLAKVSEDENYLSKNRYRLDKKKL
jgi:hypothetical protein